VPDLTPGDPDAQTLARLTITEKFAGATKAGSFRVVAPEGVVFDSLSVPTITASASAGTLSGTISVTSTFLTNDTLVIPIMGTPSISITPQAVIGPNASGWLPFKVFDGDATGANGASVTDEEGIMLAYADGTLDTFSGGDDVSVNVGFRSSTTAEGGLAGYTAESSDTAVATVTVSGTTVNVRGVAEGVATITVTDALGQTDNLVATVSTSMATPEEITTVIGSDAAMFSAGVSVDGGDTFSNAFTAGDDATVVATITPDPADVGKDGELIVGLKSNTDAGLGFYYLDVDGNWQVWDLSDVSKAEETLGPEEVVSPLASSHTVSFDTGPLTTGSYKLYFAYRAEGGALIYTGKALKFSAE
jgi:hypothetical protein